ncbi:MAG: hypothetical protein J3K34DRAFT_457902 [Monoraphidium minutum]|nr:MAG: hypothetical protein J3K34DRAFT_457902 [Monoraphidium minutum]
MKAYKLIPWALLLAAAVGGVQALVGPRPEDAAAAHTTEGANLWEYGYSIPANCTGCGMLICSRMGLDNNPQQYPPDNTAIKRLTLAAPAVVFPGKPASYKPKPAEVLAWVNTHFGLDPSILRVATEVLPADWTERVKPKGGKARRLRHVRLEQVQSWNAAFPVWMGWVDSTFVLVHLEGNTAYATTGGYLPLDKLPKTSSATANSFISPSAALAATAAAALKAAPGARADVAAALRAAAADPAGASPASVAATLAGGSSKLGSSAPAGPSIVSDPKQVAACWEGVGCGPAYKTVVFLPPGEGVAPHELHVYVDAATGQTLSSRDRLQTLKGVGKGLYNTDVKLEVIKTSEELGRSLGGRYELYNKKTKTSTRDFWEYSPPGSYLSNPYPALVRDEDNVWGTGAIVDASAGPDRQSVAVDAHFGAAAVIDYYKKVHGRASYDGKGSPLTAHVHVGFFYSNAFYKDGQVYFGDGSRLGKQWNTSCYDTPPLTTLDIVAHEFTHGVTDTSAKLIYELESGALNEATSDIMAQCFMHWAREQTVVTTTHAADFVVGADLYPNKTCTPTPFMRNMMDPQADGASYACYNKVIGQRSPGIVPFPKYYPPEWMQDWDGNMTCEADIHLSSGVYNRFFWLAAAGFSKCPAPGKPASIGVPSACSIVYRAVTQYMTPSSDFFEARAATGQAAIDLFGAASPELSAVQAAWDVVGAPTSTDGSGPASTHHTSRSSVRPVAISLDAQPKKWSLARATAGLLAGSSCCQTTTNAHPHST